MINFVVDRRKVNQLRELVGGSEKKLRQQLKIAVNATAGKTRGSMAKQVAQELATAQKNIKKTIEIKQKADAKDNSPTAIVTVKEDKRLPLRMFGARQNKKGVTYKVSKSKGRSFIPGAFVVDRYDGNVYKRPTKQRAVGFHKKGASPWGVFSKKKLKSPTVKESRKELRRQVDRRLRALKFKKSGAI